MSFLFPMQEIIFKFKIGYAESDEVIMFSELDDGTYTKTYKTPDGIKSKFIDIQEYASALATLLLRIK